MLQHDARTVKEVAAPPSSPQPRPMPTAEQIRAARALLRWSAARLARAARVAASTVARCEAGALDERGSSTGSGIPPVGVPTLQKIQRALEDAGVEFISGGNGPGVRLRRRPQ
jgi:hypothetical protein